MMRVNAVDGDKKRKEQFVHAPFPFSPRLEELTPIKRSHIRSHGSIFFPLTRVSKHCVFNYYFLEGGAT